MDLVDLEGLLNLLLPERSSQRQKVWQTSDSELFEFLFELGVDIGMGISTDNSLLCHNTFTGPSNTKKKEHTTKYKATKLLTKMYTKPMERKTEENNV